MAEEKSSSATEDSNQVGGYAYTMSVGFALFLVSLWCIYTMPVQQLEQYYIDEVKAVALYLGEDQTRELYYFGDVMGNWVMNHIPVERLMNPEARIGEVLYPLIEKMPYWVKWICRRLVLLVSVIILMIPVGMVWVSRGLYVRDGFDTNDDVDSLKFEVGNIILYNGVGFIMVMPIATLPIYEHYKPYIVGIVAFPMLIYMFKPKKWDHFVTVGCTATFLYLGPWGVLMGAFLFVFGLHLLFRQWPT
jgi:hypothetical protein